MITHLHATTVVVTDQEKALDFYVNKLGWQKTDDQTIGEMRWLTVAPPGAQTHMALSTPQWYADGEAPKPGRTGISLVARDIEATYDALTAVGVSFKQPVTVMPWGMKATWLYDPDGNEFFLAEG